MPVIQREPARGGPSRRGSWRTALALLGSLLLPVALAQRPLVPPNYYLSTLPILETGVPLAGELTPEDGQDFKDGSRLDLFRFDGRGGSRVTLTAASDVLDTTLSLFGPDGGLLATADDDPDTGSTDASLSLTLPVDGRYLVVVGGYAAEDLGPYRVTLQEATATEAPTHDLTLPAVVEDALDPSDPVAPDLFSGPSRTYAFTIDRPLLVLATLRSDAFDAGLLLYDERDTLVAFGDDNVELGGTDARLAADLPPGRYRLLVSAYDPDSGGPFRLELRRFAPLD